MVIYDHWWLLKDQNRHSILFSVPLLFKIFNTLFIHFGHPYPHLWQPPICSLYLWPRLDSTYKRDYMAFVILWLIFFHLDNDLKVHSFCYKWWNHLLKRLFSLLYTFSSFVINLLTMYTKGLFLSSLFYSTDLFVCFHANIILCNYYSFVK